jgi:hypothetical protein
MEWQSGSADFSSPISGSGPRVVTSVVPFSRSVTAAVAALTGYFVSYGNNDDHHVGQIQVQLDTAVNNDTVVVTSTLGLRDWSGNWDDLYLGTIEFVVLAELVDPKSPPPRGDLSFAGIEYNQAVQFFHSAQFLDPEHVLPDNAIPLIAGKDTGIRVYVDWDSTAAPAPITALTGQLTVQSSTATKQLSPINPGKTIVPRAAVTINQSIADQTLNFWIPGALCEGIVTIGVQTWDAKDPATPPQKSVAFERTLVFVPVKPLDLHVIGIHFTGNGVDVAAPTLTQVQSTALAFVQQTYPIANISVTGYQTMTFSKDPSVVIGSVSGCGNGFESLLSDLDDLRSGSSDIYFGVLPSSGLLNLNPKNDAGGCARQGTPDAAIYFDQSSDAPHEIGHAVGRLHAPCTHSCPVTPANVDPNYPQYGAFPSDSIGVFGFDPTTNTVFNPSTTFDFMAYSFPHWVSAYTYMALSGVYTPIGGASGGGSPGIARHAVGGKPRPALFLRLTIHRDRHVVRHHSFRYETVRQSTAPHGEFVIELLDVDREVVICAPIGACCLSCASACWPKRINAEVSMPDGIRWLIVWEGDRKLYEEWIPDPPRVVVTNQKLVESGVALAWSAEAPPEHAADSDPSPARLQYLVQWYDDKADGWRGVAPRTLEPSLIVPRSMFNGLRELRVRVLATSGLATGSAEVVLALNDARPAALNFGFFGFDERKGTATLASPFSPFIVDERGRQQELIGLTWYTRQGQEVARGPLDLGRLDEGKNELRVVARTDGGALVARNLRVDRSGSEFRLYSVSADQVQREKRTAVVPHIHPHTDRQQ